MVKFEEPTLIDAGKRGVARRLKPKAEVVRLGRAALAGLHWYALVTKSGAERPVAAQLERRGLVTVVPIRREERLVNRHSKRRHMIELPLLPRYVFVGFGYGCASGYDEELRSFFALQRDLTLVQAVVGMEGLPRRMDAEKVAAFIVRSGVVIKMLPVPQDKRPAEGDDATITDGPFEGNVVRVREIRGAEARVLMPFFGNPEYEVGVPLANLSKAD